jgi:protein associated with RNAse G/E
MSKAQDIIVRVFKYNGKEHRRWKARIVKSGTVVPAVNHTQDARVSGDDSLIVLDAEFGFAVKHAVLGEIPRGTRTAEHYWFNRWYNVFRFLEKDGSTRLWYCNINTPPILEHGVLSYIDLDIDVLVQPDFSYQVLDVDEFEQNALIFGYPDEVRRDVQSAIAEVTSLIEARQFPFTEAGGDPTVREGAESLRNRTRDSGTS